MSVCGFRLVTGVWARGVVPRRVYVGLETLLQDCRLLICLLRCSRDAFYQVTSVQLCTQMLAARCCLMQALQITNKQLWNKPLQCTHYCCLLWTVIITLYYSFSQILKNSINSYSRELRLLNPIKLCEGQAHSSTLEIHYMNSIWISLTICSSVLHNLYRIYNEEYHGLESFNVLPSGDM